MIYLNLTKGYNPFDSGEQDTIRWETEESEDGFDQFKLLSTFGYVPGIVITTKLQTIDDLFLLVEAVKALEKENNSVKWALFCPDYYNEDENVAEAIAQIINSLEFEEIATHQITENKLKSLTKNIFDSELIQFISKSLNNNEEADEEGDEIKDALEQVSKDDRIFVAIRDDEYEYVKDTASLLGYGSNKVSFIEKFDKHPEPYFYKELDKDQELKEIIVFTERVNDDTVKHINTAGDFLRSIFPEAEIKLTTIHLGFEDVDMDIFDKVYSTDSHVGITKDPKRYIVEAKEFA